MVVWIILIVIIHQYENITHLAIFVLIEVDTKCIKICFIHRFVCTILFPNVRKLREEFNTLNISENKNGRFVLLYVHCTLGCGDSFYFEHRLHNIMFLGVFNSPSGLEI